MKEAIGDLGLFALFEAMTLVLAWKLITEPFDYIRLIGAIVCGTLLIFHFVAMLSRYRELETHDLIYNLLMAKFLLDNGYSIDQIRNKNIPRESMDEMAKSLNDVYELLADQEERRPISL